MNYGEELAVQSFCFRGVKTNEEAAQKVKECGLDRIELCAVHADFTDASRFDEIVAIYKDAGVQIVSIGVQGFKGDADTERKFFEFAGRAGCTTISADFGVDTVPESYRVAEGLADEFDINLGIHNHGGRHWLGSSEALSWVFATTNDRIGLCLDTAWALDSREDPVAMAEKFGERLYGVHIKDFVQMSTAESLQDLIRPVQFVPETRRIDTLLEEFKTGRHHAAVAIDEYGVFCGFVTMDDLLEEIVGEAFSAVPRKDVFRRIGVNTALVKGIMEIEIFNRKMGTHLADSEAQSIGGYVINRLGRIPETKERLRIGNLQFEIAKAQPNRIVRMLVKKTPKKRSGAKE